MYSLTESDKSTFRQDGVVCLRGVLTAADIARLQSAVGRQLASLGDSETAYDFEAVAGQIWSTDQAVKTGGANRFSMKNLRDVIDADPAARSLAVGDYAPGEGCFLYDAAAWKQDLGVRDVAFDSALPEIAGHLLGANLIHFWEDTTFAKGPGTRHQTAFHQDLAYFQIEGDQCVIVWIPLDPVDERNGRMEYVRGSHLWDAIYAPNVFVTQTPTPASPEDRCPDIEANRNAYDIVGFDVAPGDVIIHHVRTVHGAGANLSDGWRRAMSFRYCGDQVRYWDRPGAITQHNVHHDLKDGDRLLAADYPLVWPKPWPGLRLAALYPEAAPAGSLQAA